MCSAKLRSTKSWCVEGTAQSGECIFHSILLFSCDSISSILTLNSEVQQYITVQYSTLYLLGIQLYERNCILLVRHLNPLSLPSIDIRSCYPKRNLNFYNTIWNIC